MKSWKQIGLLVGVLVFAGAAVAAGMHHGRAGFMKDRIDSRIHAALDEIQATPQQRQVVEQAENDIFNALKAKAEAHKGAHKALLTAFAGDQFDGELQSFADARTKDVNDVASVIVPALQKVHDALTPEQRAKVVQLVQEHRRGPQGGFGGE
jgi:Spy/CpxP family protein refolding chaperone